MEVRNLLVEEDVPEGDPGMKQTKTCCMYLTVQKKTLGKRRSVLIELYKSVKTDDLGCVPCNMHHRCEQQADRRHNYYCTQQASSVMEVKELKNCLPPAPPDRWK